MPRKTNAHASKSSKRRRSVREVAARAKYTAKARRRAVEKKR